MKLESLLSDLVEQFYAYGSADFWVALAMAIALSAALARLSFAVDRPRARLPLQVFALILAVIGAFIGVRLYAHRRAWSDRSLSSVHLPSGYTLRHGQGDDSYFGSIDRSDGAFSITIDIGGMSGIGADPSEPERYDWITEHQIHGRQVWIGLSRRIEPPDLRNPTKTVEERVLWITFPRTAFGAANFFAIVHTERDIVDTLSIVLTYEPLSDPTAAGL